MRHTNLKRRGRYFYCRALFTLDGKVVPVRPALKTPNAVIAYELAARMDRVLKRRWAQIVNKPAEKIDERDKASILHATALKVRDGLKMIHADQQAAGPDDAGAARLDHLRTLRGVEYFVRDIYANGVGRSLGSHDHFMDRFVEGTFGLDGDQLQRIREILDSGTVLAEASEQGAIMALLQRNVTATPVNVIVARRQMMRGALVALRETEQQALDPDGNADDLLAMLTMPPIGGAVASHDSRYAAAGQMAGDFPGGMSGARPHKPIGMSGAPASMSTPTSTTSPPAAMSTLAT